MIPLHELTDDYYEFDEKNYCITGRRTHKKYQLGDDIEVEIVRANLEKKQLDFRIAGNKNVSAGWTAKSKNKFKKGRHQ